MPLLSFPAISQDDQFGIALFISLDNNKSQEWYIDSIIT